LIKVSIFKSSTLDHAFDLDIRRAIRRAFKYTQERLKIIYKAYQAEKKALELERIHLER
jgi:hypothetical protein